MKGKSYQVSVKFLVVSLDDSSVLDFILRETSTVWFPQSGAEIVTSTGCSPPTGDLRETVCETCVPSPTCLNCFVGTFFPKNCPPDLAPILIRNILEIPLILAGFLPAPWNARHIPPGWFCSFASTKSNPNLSANSANLFSGEP